MAISRRAYLLALTLMAGLLLAFAGVASATALDTLKLAIIVALGRRSIQCWSVVNGSTVSK
jgi:hypothetical protein